MSATTSRACCWCWCSPPSWPAPPRSIQSSSITRFRCSPIVISGSFTRYRHWSWPSRRSRRPRNTSRVQVQQVVLLVIRELQGRMFAHLTEADLTRLEREAPAQLAARFTTDATIIRDALTRAVNGIADAVTVIGLVASMLYLDWLLSMIAAAMYPLAAVPIQRIGKRIRRASGGMQERMGETAAMLNESFAQARIVRAYRLEAAETLRAESAFTELYRALMRMTKGRARVDPVLEVLGGAAVAAVIGFAGWRAAISSQTIGNFTGFVAALLIAARPLRALGSLNAALQEGLAGLTRVFTVVDEPPASPTRRMPCACRQGTVMSHSTMCGSFIPTAASASPGSVSPPNQAPRSRWSARPAPANPRRSRLVPRLHDVTAGAVRIDGADVRRVTLASLRDAIAYVAQDSLLFDDSITSNIRMGHPDATDEQIAAAAEDAAAALFIEALPDGYATRVGPGGVGCLADNVNASRSPARSCAIHGSCCWMRQQARSTPKARPPFRSRWSASARSHDNRDRAPTIDGPRCRSGRRHAGRAGGRAGKSRHIAGAGWSLRQTRAESSTCGSGEFVLNSIS